MTRSETDNILLEARIAFEAGNLAKVVTLLTPLAEAGHAEAQFQLGFLYFTGCDYPASEAFSWLTRAAAQNHAEACYHLATFPSSEDFVPSQGKTDLVGLLKKAGELGSLRAQYDLGAYYATGDWVGPKDEAEAVKWYAKAAERGCGEAQYNLGLMLFVGEGTAQDTTKGIEWLVKAAEQGSKEAASLLADIYRNGLCGVARDFAQAALWENWPDSRT